jgi:cyclopropane fatty-acyl-phospholipid synthase-like methyltransferase
MYDLLDDNGIFVLQVAGIRPHWQFEDLIWYLVFSSFLEQSLKNFRGIFMNKYIFPGADASCSLGWVVKQLEGAGFEIKNIDVLGVHYSATIFRWYKNWISNKDKVIEKYGDRSVVFPVFRSCHLAQYLLLHRWYRIWVFFLAYSTIISRYVYNALVTMKLWPR